MDGAESGNLIPPNLLLWLTLGRAPGVGARTQLDLLQHFGSIENIFSAGRGQLEKALPGKNAAINAILGGPEEAPLRPELDWLGEPGHHLLVWSDPDYPPLLREIPDPPVVIYIVGNRRLLSHPQLAIVGSRNPTPMGRENARAFARSLAGIHSFHCAKHGWIAFYWRLYLKRSQEDPTWTIK